MIQTRLKNKKGIAKNETTRLVDLLLETGKNILVKIIFYFS